MRRLVKIYALASSAFCAVLLVGAAAVAVASCFSPAFLDALTKEIPAGAAWFGAAGGESLPAPAAGASPRSREPSRPPEHRLFPSLEGGAAGPARQDEPWIDVGSLEARLRYLETGVPPWSGPIAAESTGAQGAWTRLAAWESVRKPLLAFLNRAYLEGAADEPELPEEAGIEALASDIVLRLEALEQRREVAGPRIARGLEAGTLARMLAEEATVPEARAAAILTQLSSTEATQVLERLSRLSPRRAAKLLERLLERRNGDG